MRHIPVGEEREVGHQHLGREGQQAVFAAARHRQHGGARRGVDGGQHVDRRAVALRVGRAVDDDALAAEILHQQQAGLAVGGDDLRRRKADRAERRIDGEERRRRPCARKAARLSRTGGAGGASASPSARRCAVAVAHALVAAGRGVALQDSGGRRRQSRHAR